MNVLHDTYPEKSVPLKWIITWRQPFSLAVIVSCAVLFFTTPTTWQHESMTGHLIEMVSLLLIVIATFGRTWCSLYISGYKEHRVVCEGPYAIVRNPLYLFSFVGAVGLGLVTMRLSILAVIAISFLVYYPLVVLAEERNLLHVFGDEYAQYRHHVPRFIPRRPSLVEPDTYPVRPGHVRRSMQQTFWFFWAYLFLHLISRV